MTPGRNYYILLEANTASPGNTGLGKESVLQFAKHNPAHIWLAARTASKAEAAIAEVKKAVPSAQITHLSLDLMSFDSIAKAAETFKSSSDRLDILLNNAGIMAVPYGTTKEGYESQFGTNHIGPALLTKLLLPVLQKTADQPGADVRIVNLSSVGHNMAPTGGISLADTKLEKSSTWVRYGQSKLANILFTVELAKRYPNITSVAVHPGFVNTDLMNTYNKSSFLVRTSMSAIGNLFYKNVADGTKNQLWAAAAPKDHVVSGAYYVPVASKNAGSKYARDEKLASDLWDYTEKELAKHGY